MSTHSFANVIGASYFSVDISGHKRYFERYMYVPQHGLKTQHKMFNLMIISLSLLFYINKGIDVIEKPLISFWNYRKFIMFRMTYEKTSSREV